MPTEIFQHFSAVDALAAAIVLYGSIVGLRRGLSGELALLGTWAAAIAAAWYFSPPAAGWLMQRKELAAQDAYNASFVAILFAAYAGGAAVRVLLRHVVEFTFKGRLQRLGGLACGALRSAGLVALLIVAAGLLPESAFKADILEDSRVGRWLGVYLDPVYARLAERFPAVGQRAGELEEAAGDAAPADAPAAPEP